MNVLNKKAFSYKNFSIHEKEVIFHIANLLTKHTGKEAYYLNKDNVFNLSNLENAEMKAAAKAE